MKRVLAAAAALCACAASAQITGWNGSDSFSGTAVNSCNWEDVSYQAALQQNEKLTLTTNGGQAFSSPGLRTQYMLAGDFDVAVDYEVGSGWNHPIAETGSFGHLDITIRVESEFTHSIFFSRTRNRGGEGMSVYTRISGQESHNSTFRANSSPAGALRVTRMGSRVALRYGDGTSWIDLDTVDGLAEPVFVFLTTANVDARNSFTARFDNFRILSGSTSSRPFVAATDYRSRSDFRLGGVVNDYLAKLYWGNRWQSVHPLDVLKQNGFEWVRVGVLTSGSAALRTTPTSQWTSLGWREEFWSSREFAMELMRQAAARGFRLDLYLFLSDRAAHAGQQFAPPEWSGLSVDATAAQVEQSAYETVRDFRNAGLNIELYDIGNEIDFGIVGFKTGDRIPTGNADITRDLDWMRANVWNVEATLLKAGIRGVRRADPNARIVLHIAGVAIGDGNAFALAFFQSMIAAGVDFDYAGLSLPYASVPWKLDQVTPDCWFQRLQDLFDAIGTLGKRVIVSECSYPNAPAGSVAAPMPGLPFSEAGQAAWVARHLRFLSAHPNVDGLFYFYPDYFHAPDAGPIDLQNSGLFIAESQPAQAMYEARVNLAKLTASASRDQTTVTFRASVAGPLPARSFRWDFGDGSTSSEQNPRHTYAPGTFTWRVSATTDAGTVYTTGTISITGGRRRAVRHG